MHKINMMNSPKYTKGSSWYRNSTKKNYVGLALEKGFGGGDRYENAKNLSNGEILDLFQRYQSTENKMQSLFSSKIFKTDTAWSNDLRRNISKDSVNRFNILLSSPICYVCNNPITFDNYQKNQIINIISKKKY